MPRKLLLAATLLIIPIASVAQWQILNTPTTADLRGIHSLGNGIAWASGTNGTVLRTEDNGKTWQPCTTPPDAAKLDFRSIQAFDNKTAIVMSSGPGDLSRLYKTTDACQTWKLLFTNPDKEGFWDALRFDPATTARHSESHRTGALVGDPVNGQFVIYTTEDSGETWQPWVKDDQREAYKRLGPISAAKGESLFAASNSALVTLGKDELRFVTGGTNQTRLFAAEAHNPFDNETKYKFSSIKLPFTGSESSGAFSIAEKQISDYVYDLMVVGGDYKNPSVGAAAFLPHRTQRTIGTVMFFGTASQKVMAAHTPPHGYRSSVTYDTPTKTWITVGPNGTDISTDDGRNWRALKPSPTDQPDADQHWNSLSLPFVVGPHGRIGKLRPTALAAPPAAKP